MAEYYLISQLPSLDGISENVSLPITEERFNELCERFLGKKSQEAIKKISLSPPKNAESLGSTLIDAWNECEINLRFALGKVRAEKMNKVFDTENRILPVEYIKAANTAIEKENPMEAEKYLNSYRLEMLETLRPMDAFSDEYIFYYGNVENVLVVLKWF